MSPNTIESVVDVKRDRNEIVHEKRCERGGEGEMNEREERGTEHRFVRVKSGLETISSKIRFSRISSERTLARLRLARPDARDQSL